MQLDTSQILASYNLASDVIFLENGTQLSQLGVVRHVPNKRIVCQANWQNIEVYVKLFVGENVEKYAARDAAGVAQLRAANVLTPPLLYQGATSDKGAQVLVFEEIQIAKNAEDVYQTLLQNHQYQPRLDLMLQLTDTLAQHHNAGLLQTDMYLKNFLVDGSQIYTLDGDGIRKLSSIFKKRQTQRNLATLFSKMDALDDDWISKLYETYCGQTGIAYSVFDEAEIWVLTQKIRRQTASNYADKKVFRQCTDVKKYALEDAWILACTDAENINLPNNLQALDALFTAQNLLKNGNTCTVALSKIGDKEIVIKRYNIKNFWHGVSRAFRQTRASASWANAYRLKLLDIATAKPIALIEQRKFGLKGKAYFLAEYVDALDVAQFFAKTRGKTQHAEAIKNIVTLFYKLYLLQISHGDTKATNIKIVANKPVLIDLDSMIQHRFAFTFERAHVRDLNRFMQNWQHDNALYNAFVKTFRVIYEDPEPLEKAGIFNNKELN